MEIIPFASVGALSFGDSRKVARAKLASTFSTFAKVPGATETEAFDDLGLHLYYDDEGRLEFVEAFDPSQVVFRGISFLGRRLGAVTKAMKALGFDATETDVGVRFEEAGIVLTVSSGVVEGVAAFRRGYYE